MIKHYFMNQRLAGLVPVKQIFRRLSQEGQLGLHNEIPNSLENETLGKTKNQTEEKGKERGHKIYL